MSIRVENGVPRPSSLPPLPADWSVEWGSFQSPDGKCAIYETCLHRNDWSSPRALIVLHGYGEHLGRYYHLPAFLKSQFDSIWLMDIRGHGRSEGARGHVDRFDAFVDDFEAFILRVDEKLKAKFGKSELFVLGHSFGGHILIRTLLLKQDLPIRAAIASAPFLKIKQAVPFAKKLGAQLLTHIWGSLQMDAGAEPTLLSHDPEIAECYTSDRLVHAKMTPKFFSELQWAMKDTLTHEVGLQHPILFIVPGSDGVTDQDVVQEWVKNFKHREKKVKVFPEFFHEPMNEIGKEAVFAEICDWVQEHSAGSAGNTGTG